MMLFVVFLDVSPVFVYLPVKDKVCRFIFCFCEWYGCKYCICNVVAVNDRKGLCSLAYFSIYSTAKILNF